MPVQVSLAAKRTPPIPWMAIFWPVISKFDNGVRGERKVVNFFQEWIKASVMQDHKEQTRAQRVVSDFINDLHHHVLEERDLAFYADRAALSTKHFSRLVIQQTGKRPLDHIRDYLALEAKCMLAAKKYTIKQISDRLNFSNTSAFTRFFRLATGNTPAEFITTVQ